MDRDVQALLKYYNKIERAIFNLSKIIDNSDDYLVDYMDTLEYAVEDFGIALEDFCIDYQHTLVKY